MEDSNGFLVWFIGAMAFLFLAWFLTGGPQDERSRAGILLHAPEPLADGRVYGPVPDFAKLARSALPSPYTKQIAITNASLSSSSENIPAIVFSTDASSDTTVEISGWKLVNGRGFIVSIPKGTSKFIQGVVNETQPIALARQERVIITSQFSPVGISFKLDRCSGFLGEFQEFVPPLPQNCPSAKEIINRTGRAVPSADCTTYLDNLSVCSLGREQGYEYLPSACRSFVAETLNQRACAETFGQSYNFSLPVWRVFLGVSGFFDPTHDTISVYDLEDKLVGTVRW